MLYETARYIGRVITALDFIMAIVDFGAASYQVHVMDIVLAAEELNIPNTMTVGTMAFIANVTMVTWSAWLFLSPEVCRSRGKFCSLK